MRSLAKKQFPNRLLEIPEPPAKLYIEGDFPDEKMKFLAVVGARKYTPYGKEVCEKLIAGLFGQPIVIVSGLAMGIDGIAHRAALEAKLTTIAVPGSGLSQKAIYPSIHRRLAEDIIKGGGALLSEFEPEFKATPWSFPQRNRIMAGLSDAVLVIEAERRSGTLITARLATEYNRTVLTVPGSVFSANSEGPHFLLRMGATPITSSDDILESLDLEQKMNAASRLRTYEDCSPEEIQILNTLTEPKTRDELMDALPFEARKVNSLLSLLEIKGLIVESAGEIRVA